MSQISSLVIDNKRGLTIVILLGLFLALNFGSVQEKSLTTDEDEHYLYGVNILDLNSDRFDDSKMPFSAINALPAKLASYLPKGPLQAYLSHYQVARTGTMLFALVLGYTIFVWTEKLYGFAAAAFALFLFTFDPNIIAHSQLITTDIYAAGMITITSYFFWQFNQDRSWKTALPSAMTLGISQLAKYTSIFLFPLFLVLILVHDLPRLRKNLEGRNFGQLRRYLLSGLKYSLTFVGITILVINIGFLFNRTFLPLNDYELKSDLFSSVQEKLSFLNPPVPVPFPYLQGLDEVQFKERSGEAISRIYLLGDLRGNGEKINGYYLAASLFKVPIASQVFILTAIAGYLIRRKFDGFLKNELFLIGPILFFTIYFNFINQVQIGIRFFLVVFPFLYIFCGRLLREYTGFHARKKMAVFALAGYLVISTLSYYPHYLAYFNELVWDRKMGYKYLADSNLDWGQTKIYRARYMEEHPEAVLDPKKPTAGTIIMSPDKLVGVWGPDPNIWAWLRENFEPDDTIAYSNLIFFISQEELDEVMSSGKYGP